MTTINTINDLQIYLKDSIYNGVWTTPAEILVYTASNQQFTNASNVFVYKNGSWVQSWPAIGGNVAPPGNLSTSFRPRSVICSTSSFTYADYANDEFMVNSLGDMVIGAVTNTDLGRLDKPYFWPFVTLGYFPFRSHYPDADSTILCGSDLSGNGRIKIFYGLSGYTTATIVRPPPVTGQPDNWMLVDSETPANPAKVLTHTVGAGKFNNMRLTEVGGMWYPQYGFSTYYDVGRHVGAVLACNGGGLILTSPLWNDMHYTGASFALPPAWMYAVATDGFAPQGNVSFRSYNLGTTQNLNDVAVVIGNEFYATARPDGQIVYGDNMFYDQEYDINDGSQYQKGIGIVAVGDAGTIKYSYLRSRYRGTHTYSNTNAYSYVTINANTTANLNSISYNEYIRDGGGSAQNPTDVGYVYIAGDNGTLLSLTTAGFGLTSPPGGTDLIAVYNGSVSKINIPTTANLNCVVHTPIFNEAIITNPATGAYYVDGNAYTYIWVAGDNGELWRGKSSFGSSIVWTQIITNTTANLTSICYETYNTNKAFQPTYLGGVGTMYEQFTVINVVGENGFMMRTEDNGASWQFIDTGTADNLVASSRYWNLPKTHGDN